MHAVTLTPFALIDLPRSRADQAPSPKCSQEPYRFRAIVNPNQSPSGLLITNLSPSFLPPRPVLMADSPLVRCCSIAGGHWYDYALSAI